MSSRSALSIEWSFGDSFDALLCHPYPLPSFDSARSSIGIVFYRLQKMYMAELASRTQTSIPRRPLAFVPSGNEYEDDLKKYNIDLHYFSSLLEVIEVNEPNYRKDLHVLEIVHREFPRTRSVLRLIEKIIQNDLSPPPTMNLGQLLRPVSLLSIDDSIEFSSLLSSLSSPLSPIGCPSKEKEEIPTDLRKLCSMVDSLGGWNAARKAVKCIHSPSHSSSTTSSDFGRSSSSSAFNSSDSSDCDDSNNVRALFLSSVASRIESDPKKEEWMAKVKHSQFAIREQRRISQEKNRKNRKNVHSILSKKGETDEEREYRTRMEEKMKKWERKREQERMEEEFRRNQEEIARKREEERRQLQEKIRATKEAKKAKKFEKKRKVRKNTQCFPSSSDEYNTPISTSDELINAHLDKEERIGVEKEEILRPSLVHTPSSAVENVSSKQIINTMPNHSFLIAPLILSSLFFLGMVFLV